jgi:hypothetical protein
LPLDSDEIAEVLNQMDQEAKAIKEEIIRICWYMRGGINYNQAMMLSRTEREIISNLIKENLETTKNTKLPFF